MRKKYAVVMIACSLCVAAFVLKFPFRGSDHVRTTVIQHGDLVKSVLLNGSVQYASMTPCIAQKNGFIRHIYAEPGDKVRYGQLLFQMDTQTEENALSQLYQNRYLQDASYAEIKNAVSVLARQNNPEWLSEEQKLMQAVRVSGIRAGADGIVESVYIQPDEYVSASTVVGMIRGEKREIVATVAGLGDIQPGTAAVMRNGEQRIALLLKRASSPDELTGKQQLYFEAVEEQLLDEVEQGKSIVIEMPTEVFSSRALVPLETIDADGKIWIVENNRVYERPISLECCNRDYAAAALELAGKTVVLHPDHYELKDGMRI